MPGTPSIRKSIFEPVPSYAGDPILSLMEDFNDDSREGKVNLGIGLYYDERGVVPRLGAVASAQASLRSQESVAPLYLPMEGMERFRACAETHVFGEGSEVLRSDRVATIQTLGGSGALKVGADFLRTCVPDSHVWVSAPTWDNHVAIFEGAGFPVHRYPYFDAKAFGVDFEATLACLNGLPARSIVVLHPCCHNPTGADLTEEEWGLVTQTILHRGLIPFLDMAYHGFGDDLERDAYAVRTMAAAGVDCFVSNSFSKTFSLYGERIGSLSVVCSSPAAAKRVLGQLKSTVRRNYSSPPARGAALVSAVLGSPELLRQWKSEVAAMRSRIARMRTDLHEALSRFAPGDRHGYLLRQKGMFSYTGFSTRQVERLRDEHGIYLVANGRICVAGINTDNVDAVAAAFAAVG